MSFDADCVVVGAGVVGLAIARELALAGREVIVAEAGGAIGTATSSRNSEVIHAGIYYPEGSLKARLCVEGRHLLYAYCESHNVPAKRLGKLIVATSASQVAGLEAIAAKARANGVDDIALIDRKAALELEPHLHCEAALISPSTGIVDSHSLMLAYQGDAEHAGATIAFNTPLVSGEVREGGGFALRFGDSDATKLSCRTLVNSAGLLAPALAQKISGIPAAAIPRAYFCRGNYFTLSGRAPFRRLIYPSPEAAGLGVHLTLDMGGQAKFGPDVEWIDGIDYQVDPARGERFYAAIRTYWPALPDGALQPGYAGIRPKISSRAEPAADFRIDGREVHGIDGLVNLFGIESPGLTSSPAIALLVAAKMGTGHG
jgi:L-2-hydroxyglutarate oxidase LhgO